jgi:hypothetical protein
VANLVWITPAYDTIPDQEHINEKLGEDHYWSKTKKEEDFRERPKIPKGLHVPS